MSAGIVPSFEDMYVDMPLNYWPGFKSGPVFQVFYARQVRESFRVGSYFEYGNRDFYDKNGTDLINFGRYNLGLNWLGQFPKSALHMQLGGYVGIGFLNAPNWDNQKGGEIGAIAGPAYERNKFGIALHAHGGHAWYESSGTPEGVMLYTPEFLFKVYYKF